MSSECTEAPRLSPDRLAARLSRIQLMVRDLERIQGSVPPVARTLADHITSEIEAVRRALLAETRERSDAS